MNMNANCVVRRGLEGVVGLRIVQILDMQMMQVIFVNIISICRAQVSNTWLFSAKRNNNTKLSYQNLSISFFRVGNVASLWVFRRVSQSPPDDSTP